MADKGPLLSPAHPVWTSPAMVQVVRDERPGMVVRLARRAANLTQGQLGASCGYSTSTVSRIERGGPPLDQVAVRRSLADLLGIPGEFLGLAPSAQRHARPRAGESDRIGSTADNLRAGGGDPMKRRTLLAGTAGAAVAGLAGVEPASGAGLERLLLTGSTPGQHLSTDQARAGLAAAARAYRDSRYSALAKALPGLLDHLHASRDQATGSRRETFARVLARAYALASSLATKWGDDAIAMAMADRGLTAARDSGDGIAVAAATHVIAIAMRRDGLHQPALDLLTTTAAGLGADRGDPPPELLGAYGNLLCTAAYASAQAGKPADTATYLAEATAAAERLEAPVTTGVVPFSSSTVAIYKIGVYTALGDSGTALRHAESVNTAELPSAERYGRYLIDTARAAERHGHHDRAAHAVLAAARHAPGEVNRASVRELVTTLLLAPSPTSAGLRELATQIGVR